ncbi:unnamed protein product (mitochondrion) [Plasmodiophora brassicae]|uniref:Arf-GAP domain-containing protein n=2 Tax=Plasmodiophora brassicae TaxID=37360 RepID=A0A3P3YNM5_PLABS|nr:unnamed protein product [Plasmodiophora brassicae]
MLLQRAPSVAAVPVAGRRTSEGRASQKQVLAKLWRELERPGNDVCADCGAPDPEWASVNLGVLLCKACVGMHRALGVHVSVVRSITLDQWDDALLANIQAVGNLKANEFYERDLPSSAKLKPGASTEERAAFIRRKYVDKAFTSSKSRTSSDERVASPVVAREPAMPLRLVDYFLTVERGSRTSDASGMHFLESTYDARLGDRYPADDHADFPLQAESVCPFAFPDGLRLSLQQSPPSRVAFSLTSAQGVRQFVVGIMFWELLSPMEIVGELRPGDEFPEQATSVYTPRCLLLISHWPFLVTFERWLSVLYRISLSSAPLPLERFIGNFVSEVPVPPPGKIAVQFSVADVTIRLTRPPPNALPLADVRLSTLFQCLDLNNVVALFTAALTEQKVLLCSTQSAALVDVAESITALIFPFYWQGVYVPVLPRRLAEFIHSPVPFIAGVSSALLSGPHAIDIPSDVLIFNLDSNEVLMPAADTLPPLPDKSLRKLLDGLRPVIAGLSAPRDIGAVYPFNEHLQPIEKFGETGLLVDESGTSAKTAGNSMSKPSLLRFIRSPKRDLSAPSAPEGSDGLKVDADIVREQFLRFMVKLFCRYRQFIVADGDCRFDRATALRDCPDGHRALLAAVTETQMFERFIRDRCPVSDGARVPDDVRYFDEVIVAKLNRSNFHKHRSTPFLDDTSSAVTTTFVAPLPNHVGIPDDAVYEYVQFPRLKASAFGAPRHVDALIKSTEQRRAVVSTLARRVNNDLMKGRVAPQFQSWERIRRGALAIQTRYRGYRLRARFTALRRCAVFIGQRWRFVRRRRAAFLAQSALHVYLCRAHRALLAHVRSAHVLTGALQTYKSVVRARLVQASVVTLQAAVASLAEIAKRHRALRLIVRVQSRLRMQIQRRRYLVMHARVVSIQAIWRGIRVRRHQLFVIREGIASCRLQLSDLWRQLGSDLQYRSQFWTTLDGPPSYLSWMMHIEEAHRLQAEASALSPAAKALNAERLRVERAQIYVALKKRTSSADRERLFAAAGLTGGHRKKRLSELVWSKAGDEALSASVVLTAIPGGDLMTRRKRERVRSALHATTMSSLKAVVRLQTRVAVLRAEARAAASHNERLSIRNQILLRQARLLAANAAPRTPSLPVSSLADILPSRTGFKPQFIK